MSNFETWMCFFCENDCPSIDESNIQQVCSHCKEFKMCQFIEQLGGMDAHRPNGLDRCLPFRVSKKPGKNIFEIGLNTISIIHMVKQRETFRKTVTNDIIGE